jgi:hypothetical protein
MTSRPGNAMLAGDLAAATGLIILADPFSMAMGRGRSRSAG